MKRILVAATALSLLAAGAPALADHGRHDKHHAKAHQKAMKAQAKAHRKAMREEAKAWRKGQRLPASYYDGYIDDPNRYGLRQAPPGYRWVLVEDDAYLVQRENGLINDIIWSVLGR